MKLYTFELGQQRRLGAEWQGQLVDLAVAYEAANAMQTLQPNRLRAFPGDMLTFLRIGAPAVEAAAEAMAFVKKRRAGRRTNLVSPRRGEPSGADFATRKNH